MYKILLTLLVLLSINNYAKVFYVDSNSGSDSNTGTSILSPWKTISKVNAVTMAAGDSVLFKRGGTWFETLNAQSGTSTASILYGAYGEGNMPLFNANASLLYSIRVYQDRYITIENLEFTNLPATGSSVRISWSNNVVVKGCKFFVNGRAGVFIEESQYIVVDNNRISTPQAIIYAQTDGIYAQRNKFNTYKNNHIVISNQHLDQHADPMQLYQETSSRIMNNYVEQDNTKTGTAQGIYVEQPSGVHEIFNNVAYGIYTQSSLIKFKNYGVTFGSCKMIGNTVYGGKGNLIQTDDSLLVFKNNIVVTIGSSAPVRFEKTIVTPSNVDHNLYLRYGTGNLVFSATTTYSMSTWKSMGYDVNTLVADPLFKDPTTRDFSLLDNSPAINKGLILPEPFNIDKNNVSRPQGSSFDIGANEKVSSVVIVNLPTELGPLTTYKQGKSTLLKWYTITELNTLRFEVQRSKDQINWTTIGHVNAAGTSTSQINYSYVDQNIRYGSHSYRIKLVDNDGSFSYSKVFGAESNEVPLTFGLSQNYPNPFNPSTTIKFSLPEKAIVKIAVYNITGSEVAVLSSGAFEAGEHSVEFDGSNLASGVYVYKIESAKFSSTKKMMLLK